MLYWLEGELVFENFALRTRVSAAPLVCAILHFCGGWRSVDDVASHLRDYAETSVLKTLNNLCENGLLERSEQKRHPRVEAMESWAAWNPAAGFFHFSTKDTELDADQLGAFEELKRRDKARPNAAACEELCENASDEAAAGVREGRICRGVKNPADVEKIRAQSLCRSRR